MSGVTWLDEWCEQHVNATVYEDRNGAKSLAALAQKAANEARISIPKELEDTGHNDLTGYMLEQLNDRADSEVNRLVKKTS